MSRWCAVALSSLLFGGVLATGARAQEPPPESAAEEPSPAEQPAAETTPAVSALPEALRPEISLRVTPEEDLHVGVPIHVEVVALAGKDDRVSVPKRALDPFEVLDRHASRHPEGERVRHTFELTLLTFSTGEVTLPPLELRVVTGDQHIGSVFTEARVLQVDSYLANEPNAELAPATEPVQVIEDDFTLAWIGAGLLAALVLAALGYAIARYRARRPKPAAPPAPPRPPWDIALERLDALAREREAWVSGGRATEYVDQLSDVVRAYLGARYGFDGLESTSDEVVRELARRRPRDLPMNDVVTLLSECDLVKFAKAEPDPGRCVELHRSAVEVVERTQPRATAGAEARA